MSADSSSDDRDPVERLAEEFVARHRRGERPLPEDYAERHPQWGDRIRALFPALLLMEQHKPGLSESGEEADPRDAPLEQLGDYRIIREIGRGGMAVVYEAEQESLGRHVALKVLLHGRLDPRQTARFDREARAAARLHHTNIVPVYGVGEDDGIHYYVMQFIPGQALDEVLREVRRLRRQGGGGRMGADDGPRAGRDGSAAASATDVARGLVSGRFAPMEPEPGSTRSSRSRDGSSSRPGDDARSTALPPDRSVSAASMTPAGDSRSSISGPGLPDPSSLSGPVRRYWRGVARIGEQVAEALQYAHAQGVLHRDIKPSNLLLDLHGAAWVADFGLAKQADQADLTHTGDVVGTWRYMAPERFRGVSDARSDVYSLGLTLYELMVLRPAFDGATREELLHQVGLGVPPGPRKVNPEVPRDLETIILKAIERDPERRYQSAGEMAEDLRRFLEDRPIRARRCGPAERAWRWARRNPAVAALAASVVLLLAALAVGSTLAAVWLNAERKQAVAHLWDAYMAQAHAGRSSRLAGQRFTSLDVLREAAKIRITDELRNEAIASMALVDVRPVRQFATIPHEDDGVAVDSALERYALGDGEGNVGVYRVADGREILRLPRGLGPSRALGFSPDGRYLIAAYAHQGIGWSWVLWDIGGDKAPRKVMEPGNINIHFSPDGRRVAMRLSDCALGLYDPATGELRKRLNVAPMYGVGCFHPGGRRIMLVAPDRTLRLIDVESGDEVWSHAFEVEIDTVAWRGDGRLVAAGGRDHRIYVWDMAADRLQSVLEGHQNTVVGLQFTHEGSLLISSSWDGGARVWDPVRGTHLLTLPGGLLGLRPDDRRVVLREKDSRLGLWELADGRECRALHHGMVGNRTPRPDAWGPNAVDFSPDGRLLASSEGDGVRLWAPSTGRPIAYMPVGGVGTLQFSTDGSHLLTQVLTGANAWPLRKNTDGSDEGLRIGPPRFLGSTRGLGLSTRDRASPYVTLTDYTRSQAVVLDLSSSAEIARLGPHPGLNQCSISPDGRWVATATWKGKDVKVWEVATGRLAWQFPCDSAYVSFSPDGRWLAVVDFPKPDCLLWHVGSWQPARTIRTSGGFNIMTFSRDGRMLAIDDGGRVRLVDPESGRDVATLDAGTGSSTGFFCMAFSADGAKLAAGRDHIVHVWDLRRIRGQLAAMGLDWDAPPIPAAETAPASDPIHVRIEGADWLTAAAAGDHEARAGHWDVAAAAHARAVADGAEDPLVWQRRLLFLLRAGDSSGYRDGCAALVSRFQGEDRPGFVEPIAWACSLGPDAPAEWSSLISATEAAVERWPQDAELRKTLGAALVRAGRPRQAISALEESVRLNGCGGNAFDWLFLALAHHRLGHSKQATSSLAAARDWIAHGDERAIPDPYLWSPLRWYTKLELEVLLREAEGEITGAAEDLPEAVFATVQGTAGK